jgi:PadR family transcriptional regulator
MIDATATASETFAHSTLTVNGVERAKAKRAVRHNAPIGSATTGSAEPVRFTEDEGTHQSGACPCHQQDKRSMARELERHGYKISPGMLYPTLHRLEAKGLLAAAEH